MSQRDALPRRHVRSWTGSTATGPAPGWIQRRHRVCKSWTPSYGTLIEEPTDHVAASMKPRWIHTAMPSLRSLVQRRSPPGPPVGSSPGGGESPSRVPLVPVPRVPDMHGGPGPSVLSASSSSPSMLTLMHEDSLGRAISYDPLPTAGSVANMRRCGSMEPVRAVNRLRAGSRGSLMCSRCSSLLSMASSSRYSLNTAGGGFVRAAGEELTETLVLCKLCLGEVPQEDTTVISQCGCAFCNDCMRCYVEFEIQEGAYDISCPDAQCCRQGVISLGEVQQLVTEQHMAKYKRFRLNREVDMDVSRLWCPKAGCETICHICPTGERCLPQTVRCPTCTSDFCSNCKHPWHGGMTCEENTRLSNLLTKEPGIPFDNDLIKCCPMCSVPIEKDEGCAQMMCKRCKHVFCWYCLASLDDDFLLRHYDKGPCKNKLGHSRASVIWHRTQVIGIFAGFGILLLVASPLLLLAAPCIVCCKCRVCSGSGKLEPEEDT